MTKKEKDALIAFVHAFELFLVASPMQSHKNAGFIHSIASSFSEILLSAYVEGELLKREMFLKGMEENSKRLIGLIEEHYEKKKEIENG